MILAWFFFFFFYFLHGKWFGLFFFLAFFCSSIVKCMDFGQIFYPILTSSPFYHRSQDILLN